MHRWLAVWATFGIVALVGRPARAQVEAGVVDEPGAGAPAEPAPAQPAPAECFPACRAGYTCHQGKCVSLCNPPCAATEECTSAGQCIARQAAPPPYAPPPYSPAPAGPADPGWSGGAAAFGWVSAGIITVLTAVIVAADDADVGIPVGGAATLYAGVSIPIVAVGGASARTHPLVTGYPGLRIAGWIGYGVTLFDALILLGVALSDGEVTQAHVASVGALGTLTAIGFALDASGSAGQAEAIRAQQQPAVPPRAAAPPVAPALGLAEDATGERVGVLGLRWSF
jgi:hypothetical protein